ncbi:chorismate mutase [Maridesulfovibrio hydrothermalis]|uniref:chorismate mutase n=1 Tax=Maridesulfovibrio hydrothermalis AM13 = DSM 14728 TaxID=1121451 RepID=L0R9G4_9BACT|nr:chorismate mutase [Maridesulfovibrio hydrothermalis]CCO22835.1 5-enolpyruvylshikimate-3-phosphate synthase-like protein [Maridesulfovibrio hydrothermalis AM13 = DSM 14728]
MPNYKKFDRNGASAPRRPSLLDEIKELDARLLSLVSRRNYLMGKAASKRKQKGLPLADPDMERRIFETWKTEAGDKKFDVKTARRVFDQLNNLAYATIAKPENRKLSTYVLSPSHRAVNVNFDGPSSLFQSKLWLALAAACSADVTLSPLCVNDQITELVKAFNQAGAHLSWDGDTVESRSGEGIELEDKLIFAGNDPMTMYLIIAFGLKTPGKFKIAGGPILKQYDSRPISKILAPLGARLNTLDLQSHGLPARLECGGRMASSVEMLDDTPPEFAAALALAAWTYPQGLSLRFAEDWKGVALLKEVVSVLKSCGIKADLSETECTVKATKQASYPQQPEIALEPELCAALLAIPAFAGGNMTINGTWPANSTAAADAIKLLAGGGLNVDVSKDSISVSRGELPEDISLDFGTATDLFPIGLALAINTRKESKIQNIEDTTMFEQGIELLERLGIRYERGDSELTIFPGRLNWDEAWSAPTPFFGMALGQLAWLRPGISLENPGDLTDLWPRFWTLYNSLPEIDGLKDPEAKNDDEAKSSRRRIKIN